MAIEYQISQLFRSAYTNTDHVIYTTTMEDSARRTFDTLKQELPVQLARSHGLKIKVVQLR
jgi:hypothetical protein